jgi:hypothetical protein
MIHLHHEKPNFNVQCGCQSTFALIAMLSSRRKSSDIYLEKNNVRALLPMNKSLVKVFPQFISYLGLLVLVSIWHD